MDELVPMASGWSDGAETFSEWLFCSMKITLRPSEASIMGGDGGSGWFKIDIRAMNIFRTWVGTYDDKGQGKRLHT